MLHRTAEEAATWHAEHYANRVAAMLANEEGAEWELPSNECHDTIIRVHCYGGGPAGGVEFKLNVEDNDWATAHTWHQEWFEPRVYAELDDDTAQFLWDWWGFGGQA